MSLFARTVAGQAGRILFGGAVLGTLAYAVWVFTGENPSTKGAFSWIYDGSILAAGLACLTMALAGAGRPGASVAFGLGLIAWGAGDVYWSQTLADLPEIPYPSWADAGYLIALPFFFAGIAFLIRGRVGQFTLASWLDGLIAALAAAAAGTAFLAPALIGLTEGDPTAVLTNLAYPLGDLILLAFIVGALVVSGVRRAGTIMVVASGLLIWCFADIIYLYQEGTTGYTGGWIDLLWPIGALFIAACAQLPSSLTVRPKGVYRSSLIPPAVSTLVATLILIGDHVGLVGHHSAELHGVSVALAGATILAALVRLTVSFRENDRLLDAVRGEAITDGLTGLGNRRKLLGDLEDALADERSAGYLFALFDLDGFKSYNDSFGHPAGDALLQRLGDNLAMAVGKEGAAYRLGGDEFCVLARWNATPPLQLLERSRSALSEAGEGFRIGASGGSVMLPQEADAPAEALHTADQRMYSEKRNSSRSLRQTQDFLMQMLRSREPELAVHVDSVTEKALRLGRSIGLESEQLDILSRAAQLHDIGKIAIPDDILHKRGPLDELEWNLMRRHTLIGERIINSAAAMRPIARVVRSSHERWDGKGYPDALAEDEIPLESRIIFISDAYDAMTTDRPYKKRVSESVACEELRRCAGTQFDPELVGRFCDSLQADPEATAADSDEAATTVS